MDKRHFVRIEVPTFDGKGLDQQGMGGATGTGYPIGEDLILTARHVIRQDERDSRYPIRVRWHSFPNWGEKSDGVVELCEDDDKAIVWEGVEEIDIALLHCSKAPESVEPGRLLNRRPSDGDLWRSIGFPRATHFDEGRTQNAFGGEILVLDEPWFQIGEKYPPDTAEDWMGASGMPIFVEGRIIGVFSASLGRIQGKGLALPIQPLLEGDAEFRELVRYDERLEKEWREYRAAVGRDVADELMRAPGARQELLKLVDCPAARRVDVSDRDACKLLSDELLEMAFADFAGLANKLYRKLHGFGDSEEGEVAAQTIFRIAHRLAPALYDPGVVRVACEQCDSTALIELPVAMHTVAELAVAAADARAAEFRPRRGKQDEDPLGARSLPAVVPELGIEVTSETISDRLEKHIVRKQMHGERFDGKVFLADLDDYLDTTFYPLGRPSKSRDDSTEEKRARWKGIDRALLRKGRESRFYLVFRPCDKAEFESMKKTADVLKDRYPHLTVLFLDNYRADGDGDLWDREADQVFDFCQMLPIAGTPKP